MLLVWARAYGFALEHGLELYVAGWSRLKLGPIIRNEKHKRLYWGYFRGPSVSERVGMLLRWATSKKIYEPEFTARVTRQNTLYIFHECKTNEDFFKYIKPYRNEVKTAIQNILSPALRRRLDKEEPPVIGVHIRRGDFKLGCTITPVSFFVDAIKTVRALTGELLPVTLFTDANPDEVADVLSMPAVKMATPKADILDLLLLGRSRYCIISIGSTFSFWGAFLCDGVVLKHPDEWQPDIRPADVNKLLFEGSPERYRQHHTSGKLATAL